MYDYTRTNRGLFQLTVPADTKGSLFATTLNASAKIAV